MTIINIILKFLKVLKHHFENLNLTSSQFSLKPVYNPGYNHLSNNNKNVCFLMLSVAVHGVTKNILGFAY